MDIADQSDEPHSYEDYAIRDLDNGRTYDYHGDLISTSQSSSSSQNQEFTGTWEVVSRPTNEVVYTFTGIGNAVQDAERLAARWASMTGFDDPIYVRPVMQPRRSAAESAEYIATLQSPHSVAQQVFRFNSSYPVANYDQAVAVLRVALRDQGYSVAQIDNLRVVGIESGDHRFIPPDESAAQTLQLEPLFNVRWIDDNEDLHDINIRAPNANAAMDRVHANLTARGLGVRSIEANPVEQSQNLEYIATLQPPHSVAQQVFRFNSRYPITNYDQAVAALRVALRRQGYSVEQIDNMQIVSIEGTEVFRPPTEQNSYRVTYTISYRGQDRRDTSLLRARNADAAMATVRQNLERAGYTVLIIDAEPAGQSQDTTPARGAEDLPPGNMRWRILDQNDREVYSFINTTSQAQANSYAMDWLRRNGILGSGEFYVVPVQ